LANPARAQKPINGEPIMLSPYDRIVPYFQPIFSADTGLIHAFEVLGRYIDDSGQARSLGPIFANPYFSGLTARKIDALVKKKAMQTFASEGHGFSLFVNVRLEWIDNHCEERSELTTLKYARLYGVQTDRLVIEITEEEYLGPSDIHCLLEAYRKTGCRIALDDYGKRGSTIERLAAVFPDIIKINMEHIHKSEKNIYFREYIKSLAEFGQRIGVDVLYEGVETKKQIDICQAVGGRYYQGFILAKPQPALRNALVDFDLLANSFALQEADETQPSELAPI
jgi:EAL domain-containing protein (putative c-di-GMP-specific phosphodiesterase class I)